MVFGSKRAAQIYRRAKHNRKLELKFELRKAKETPPDKDDKARIEDEETADNAQHRLNASEGRPNRSNTLKDLFRPVARWAPQLSSMAPLWMDRRLKL
ncbi:hypothetical protein C8F04DRAFT_1276190 [Mycena alexandri]|uniref:Uncharacterized protein n=1 Tax=Mycena alexandri TaxID=1745969 RepID=A0AAD6WSM5_9AGAR|nr:hypothetical protein C8F04DRAFT_1276190 [Mycena alexandri]